MKAYVTTTRDYTLTTWLCGKSLPDTGGLVLPAHCTGGIAGIPAPIDLDWQRAC